MLKIKFKQALIIIRWFINILEIYIPRKENNFSYGFHFKILYIECIQVWYFRFLRADACANCDMLDVGKI